MDLWVPQDPSDLQDLRESRDLWGPPVRPGLPGLWDRRARSEHRGLRARPDPRDLWDLRDLPDPPDPKDLPVRPDLWDLKARPDLPGLPDRRE